MKIEYICMRVEKKEEKKEEEIKLGSKSVINPKNQSELQHEKTERNNPKSWKKARPL